MGKTKQKLNFDVSACYVCGNPNTQWHHIYYGNNRQNSTKYGYIIGLCLEHHTGNTGVHFNTKLDKELKQMAQRHFEQWYGYREDFIKIFGRNYLDD